MKYDSNNYIKKTLSVTRYLATMGLFFAAAVFALILARGNTITEEGISQTGTIRLNNELTDNIEVYLDEQPQDITNSKTVEGVIPGKYILRIEEPGFTDWEQEVQIVSGLITDIDFQLFPEELQLTSVDTKDITQLFVSPDRSRIFYSVTDSPIGANIGLWQRNLQSNTFAFTQQSNEEIKISNQVGSISSAMNNGNLEVLPSPDNRKLLISNGSDYYVLETDQYNEPSTENLLDIKFPVDSISWLKDSNNILILSDKLLVDFDIVEKTSTIIYYDGIRKPIYTSTNGVVYYYDQTGIVRYNSGVSNPVSLTNLVLPSDLTGVYSARNSLQNLVLESESGLYFLNIEQSFLTALGKYQLVSISPSGENLILANEEANFSVDILISKLRDTVNVSIKEAELPISTDTDTLRWSSNSSYILFQQTGNGNLFSADQLGNNITSLLADDMTNVQEQILLPNDEGAIVLIEDVEKSILYLLEFEVE
jgi:hypothetical protein